MSRNLAAVVSIESGRRKMNKEPESEKDVSIIQPVCMICHSKPEGYYGRWGNVGTCRSKCERIQAAKLKYPKLGTNMMK